METSQQRLHPEIVRAVEEVRDALRAKPGTSNIIDLSGKRLYVRTYPGKTKSAPHKDLLGIVFYSNKKATKLSMIGTLIIERAQFEALKLVGDIQFNFLPAPEPKKKLKSKVRARASSKKR